MLKLISKNNYLFVIDSYGNITSGFANEFHFQEQPDGKFDLKFDGSSQLLADGFEFSEFADETNTPFANAEDFVQFYTSKTGVPSSTGSGLTDSQLRANPIQVEVVNQIDLTAIESLLSEIKDLTVLSEDDLTVINGLVATISDNIEANADVNHQDLIDLKNYLNGIDTNTDELETKLNSIISNTNGASTLAKQQETIDLLESMKQNQVQPFGFDAGGRTRVSQLTTLLDGKILGADDTNLFENVGTGTFTFQDNTMLMQVTAGQYCIRQSKRFCPYFSGKSQLIEETFEDFQLQAGIIKRIGYFSSNAVAPFTSNYDGFWIESNGDDSKFYVRASKNGTLTLNNDVSAYFLTYNAENFTVTAQDFLWLGGAELRSFIKNTDGFDILSLMDFAGKQKGTFMLSPNQPIRYEIRSTSGTGQLRYICSQVASEGSFSEAGKTLSIFNLTSITANVVGTIYALKSLRKQVAFRDTAVQILDISVSNTATSDAGILMLFVNPTLSAPLTYSNNSRIQEGTATNQTITAGTGRLVCALPINVAGSSSIIKENFLSFLSQSINNTMDEFVLAYMPTTLNQSLNGVINLKEF
jgi:hypothetical protein